MNRKVLATSGFFILSFCLIPSLASAMEIWAAYQEGARLLARRFSDAGPGKVLIVADGETAVLPPSVAIGADGLPAIAWVSRGGDIFCSRYNGSRWSPPELVSASNGRHRGIPSLALDAETVLAWAESEHGLFEDIFYAVRAPDGWTAPRCAHEPNDLPDILPCARACPGGGFSIIWKRLEGEKYVEKRIGDCACGGAGKIPEALFDFASRAELPAGASLAWRGGGGDSGSALLKEILDECLPAGREGDEPDRKGVESTGSGAINIIAFGDSITYGRGSSSNGPRTGYPVYLGMILGYNYPGQAFRIINEGKPGERTEGGLERIDEVLDRYRADYILIMEGMNDLYFNISSETIQENLKRIALRAAARGVFPILSTVTPADPTVSSRWQLFLKTSSFYAGGYVQEISRRYRIPFADQWWAFVSIPDFAGVLMDHSSGNHPNDNGYRYVMAPEWYETLAPHLDVPFEPVSPRIELSESASLVTRGGVEEFGYSLSASNDLARNIVDFYVALRKPTGQLVFFNSRWRQTPTVTPVARKLRLNAVPSAGDLFSLPIDVGEPAGEHTIYAVAVRSLKNPLYSVNWSSNLAEVRFTVSE